MLGSLLSMRRFLWFTRNSILFGRSISISLSITPLPRDHPRSSIRPPASRARRRCRSRRCRAARAECQVPCSRCAVSPRGRSSARAPRAAALGTLRVQPFQRREHIAPGRHVDDRSAGRSDSDSYFHNLMPLGNERFSATRSSLSKLRIVPRPNSRSNRHLVRFVRPDFAKPHVRAGYCFVPFQARRNGCAWRATS